MPPMLRNPLRPGGPRKTNPATVRISTVAAGRMPASMAYPASLGKPQDAASMRKLERGHRVIRAKA